MIVCFCLQPRVFSKIRNYNFQTAKLFTAKGSRIQMEKESSVGTTSLSQKSIIFDKYPPSVYLYYIIRLLGPIFDKDQRKNFLGQYVAR